MNLYFPPSLPRRYLYTPSELQDSTPDSAPQDTPDTPWDSSQHPNIAADTPAPHMDNTPTDSNTRPDTLPNIPGIRRGLLSRINRRTRIPRPKGDGGGNWTIYGGVTGFAQEGLGDTPPPSTPLQNPRIRHMRISTSISTHLLSHSSTSAAPAFTSPHPPSTSPLRQDRHQSFRHAQNVQRILGPETMSLPKRDTDIDNIYAQPSSYASPALPPPSLSQNIYG
ncbi:hypothetical protein C8J56DRAFT_879908 [Mycena floridula]|nr:hypothetical protein C8J56DRAFT_879908 [Mycena floridula]